MNAYVKDPQKKSKKFEKNLLTNSTECAIINTVKRNANCGANVAPDRRSSTDSNRAKKVEKIQLSS